MAYLSQPLPALVCRLDPAPSPPPGSHGNLAERGRCWLIHTAWGYCCLHLQRQSPGLNLILTGFHEPNRKLSPMVSFHVHCLLHMVNDPPAEVTREKFTALVSTLPSCFRTFSRLVSHVPSRCSRIPDGAGSHQRAVGALTTQGCLFQRECHGPGAESGLGHRGFCPSVS